MRRASSGWEREALRAPAPLTIGAAFEAAAARVPGRTAIEYEGCAISYAELELDSRRLAIGLSEGTGLASGDRVGVLMGNRPEFVIAVLAVARAGLAAVPLPAGSTVRELAHLVADSGLRLVLTDEAARADAARAAAAAAGGDVHVLPWTSPSDGAPDACSLIARASPGARPGGVEESSAFFFGYTSGTTGAPKAAVVSHRARTLLALAHGHEYGCYAPGEHHLIVTPMYHGAGLSRALAPLLAGASIELHPRFDPERAVRTFAAGRVTATFMVPTMFSAIFHLDARLLELGAGALRTVLSNASALPEHLKLAILDRWPGVRLFEIYGSTEAGTVASLRPEDQLRKQRCVGLPLALTEVEVRRPDGEPAGIDEVGQLHARSPFVFSGYHGDPEATARVMRDGFVTAGDLCRRDAEGYLYIVGRAADVIVSGGVNVYPREVEEYLAEHPGVSEAVVVGVADPHWGEAVHAVVVPERGATPSPAELVAHCRRGLAAAKVPKSITLIGELPRTPSGKVLRRTLAGRIARAPGTGGGE
jgi:long-chain acyl-CoA synthetase